MKRILSFILASTLMLALGGCGTKEPVGNKETGGKATMELKSMITLPDYLPKDFRLFPDGAVIVDGREHPPAKAYEITYLSDSSLETLRDFYKAALKDGKNFSSTEFGDGYNVSAKINDIDYIATILKLTMGPDTGRSSVRLSVRGLKEISDGSDKPKGEGKAWPSADLPGVPELKGHIKSVEIDEDDHVVRVDVIVDSADAVRNYVGELENAGFRNLPSPENLEDEHMEFDGSSDASYINIGYKGSEKSVCIQYMKSGE